MREKWKIIVFLILGAIFFRPVSGNVQVHAATKCQHQFALLAKTRFVNKEDQAHIVQKQCSRCLKYISIGKEKHSFGKIPKTKYVSDKQYHTLQKRCIKCASYINVKQGRHIFNSQPVNRLTNGVCDSTYHNLKMRCISCNYRTAKKEIHRLKDVRTPYYDSQKDKNLFYHSMHQACNYCDYATEDKKEKHAPKLRTVVDANAKTKHLNDEYYTLWNSSQDYIGQCKYCKFYCWQGEGYAKAAQLDSTRKRMISKAMSATGIKYRLGGTSLTSGVDCSGLIWTLLNSCKAYPYCNRYRFSTSDTSRRVFFDGATIQNLSADGGKTINPAVLKNLHIGDFIITPYPVPSKSHGSYGHIAIVIKANPDRMTFECIEAAGATSGFGRVVHTSNREYSVFGDYLVEGKYYTGQVIHWHK